MDDFHAAFVAGVERAVTSRSTPNPVIDAEMDLAHALFQVAGRWAEKFRELYRSSMVVLVKGAPVAASLLRPIL